MSYKFVEKIIKTKSYLINEIDEKPLPKHENIRGGNYYY